jgi:hypothetical protein
MTFFWWVVVMEDVDLNHAEEAARCGGSPRCSDCRRAESQRVRGEFFETIIDKMDSYRVGLIEM